MGDFLVPASYGSFLLEEKKSRFIAEIWQVHSEEEAKAHLASRRKEYHDASHHCWCYIIDPFLLRYSDDGEPQGTAGQPMLQVFQQENIQQVCCVVTRYFGGTELGKGGLARAYGQSAKGALLAVGLCRYETLTELELICPYPLWNTVEKALVDCGAKLVSTEFGLDISVRLQVLDNESCLALLTEQTAGQVLAEIVGQVEELVPVETQ